MAEQWRTLAGIISSLGLVTLLIVIIGRLWTTAYFDYFGLETSDLEFSVYDFAFRSLEGLTSIVLGVVGFSAAWMSRSWLEKRGFIWALGELAVRVSLLMLLLVFFVDVPEWGILPDGFITGTGVLGIASGLVLVAMVWFIVDLWEGPGLQVAAADDLAKATVPVVGEAESAGQSEAEEASPETGGGSNVPSDRRWWWFLTAPITWRIFAVVVASATFLLYLPFISQQLAEAEARADLASGKFPIAVLESDSALPSGIASDGAPLRSVAVRVILTQSRNTYVLHSTQCTAIGALEVEKGDGEKILTTRSDFCRVFAIPTSRLVSIEYIQVSGSPPSNDTTFLAEGIDLSEPFEVTASTIGASDDEDIGCGNTTDSGFKRTVWYRFVPSTDGTLLATVTIDADLQPVVAILEELEEGILEEAAASGSGEASSAERSRQACETAFKTLKKSPLQGARRVATIADVQTGMRYLIAMGTRNDKGGALNIFLEFTPGATFLYSKIPRYELPTITLPSIPGLVQMELREFDMARFELVGSDDSPGEFSLVSEGNTVRFGEVEDQEDKTSRTLLETEKVLDPGTWMLKVPEDFVGQVTLSVTTIKPDLILAFAEPSAAPLNDIRVQGALLLVINEVEIRDRLGLDGPVIFEPDSFDPDALTFEAGENAVSTARELLEELSAELTVQIQIEVGQEEERQTLVDAADILQQQLVGLGLDVAIASCENVCIRVYFGSKAA